MKNSSLKGVFGVLAAVGIAFAIKKMADRKKTIKGIFEEYCEHGIGHPTPEDRRFLQETNQEWRGVHGCDGCCAFIKATRELHVRLKDRDTWAEFYNDDRDIEVLLDALNKGHEVEQMSIGSGTTYILDNGLYLVEVMEEDK